MFQCPHGLELLPLPPFDMPQAHPLFQCPHGLELLPVAWYYPSLQDIKFQCPHGLELLRRGGMNPCQKPKVSMPSWA